MWLWKKKSVKTNILGSRAGISNQIVDVCSIDSKKHNVTFTIAASSLARPVVLIMFHKPAPPDTSTWNPKPFINGCFNWMIPNLYIGNGCFTKHPFLTGCLGHQVCLIIFLGGIYFLALHYKGDKFPLALTSVSITSHQGLQWMSSLITSLKNIY